MFSNILVSDYSSPDKGIKSIYQKLQNFLGRGVESNSAKVNDDMLSARGSTVASDDSFITPVSSVGDLMAMSPKRTNETYEQCNETSDLLTGPDLDSICDITMKEIPHSDDMFIDANSLDYLVKCAESNRNHNHIDRGKESLFVKFDPLYARQKFEDAYSLQSDAHSAVGSSECDVGYETGSTISVVTDSHVAMPRHSLSTSAMPSASGKDKPMQVVPPVMNNEYPKTHISQVRTPGLMRSVSAILTPTRVATERLISISGSTPPTAAPRSPRYHHNYNESDHLHSLRVILQKQDQEVVQLRQQNRELKSTLQDTEHRYSRIVEDLNCKVKKLTDERENFILKENKLLEQINEKILSNKQMSIVMEEYEKTISSLIDEQQHEKITKQDRMEKVIAERDEALAHLENMECSFNDLLAKYEKCKSVIFDTKEREKVYEQKISEYQAAVTKYEELYANLKQVTSDELTNSNKTLENLKKNYNIELTKLNATVKKHEITIASLQESLVQRTKDNEELMRLYDQLISEVH